MADGEVFKIHSTCGKLKKNKAHGGLGGYKYAELAQVLEMLQPILEEEKKFVTFDLAYETIGAELIPFLVGSLRDEKNNVIISSKIPLLGIGNTVNTRNSPMQNLGSAITYARRYCLLNMFNLCAEDDDGDQGINFQEIKINKGSYGEWE